MSLVVGVKDSELETYSLATKEILTMLESKMSIDRSVEVGEVQLIVFKGLAKFFTKKRSAELAGVSLRTIRMHLNNPNNKAPFTPIEKMS